MGSPDNDADANDREKPQYKVYLDGYYISKYQVTQKLWKQVMGKNPSEFKFKDENNPVEMLKAKLMQRPVEFKGKNNPVEMISWYDAIKFCNKLSQQSGLEPYYNISGKNISINKNAKGYRLPTEAEWEYAARGGNKSQGYKYAGSNNIDDVARCQNNSNYETYPVGKKQANELGIYDMSGNVWEWCWDWYGDYNTADVENSLGADKDWGRVIRGGSWYSDAVNCRVACRGDFSPGKSLNDVGFRVVSR